MGGRCRLAILAIGLAALTSLAAPGSAKRHCEDERNQFCARVLAADAGVRHVIKSDPEADQIVEAIVEFRAGAELGMGPKVDAGAVAEIPDRSRRGDYPSADENNIKAKTAIAVKAPLPVPITPMNGATIHSRSPKRYSLKASPVAPAPGFLVSGNTSNAPPLSATRSGSSGEPKVTCAVAG